MKRLREFARLIEAVKKILEIKSAAHREPEDVQHDYWILSNKNSRLRNLTDDIIRPGRETLKNLSYFLM